METGSQFRRRSIINVKQLKNMQNNIPKKLIEDINKSRETLRLKKPKVYKKLINYLEAEKENKNALYLLDFAYDFECNFRCPHCCAKIFREIPAQKHMSIENVKVVADQADKAGIFIINLIGGEPLIWRDFDKIMTAINPDRFHISLTTNGWMLDKAKAKYLAEIGIDKIGVSIDSGFESEHDSFRQRPGSYQKTIEAVKNASAAGIRTIISTIVTHQNIRKEGFKKLLELSAGLNVGLDLQCATVSGGWRGNTEVLIDEKDAQYLENLRKEYPLLRRDVWTVPGSQGGCPASTKSLYIIPSGDVLPCLFIHISFGNILKEPLALIQERMLKVKELRKFSSLCLAGEDRKFIELYLSKTFNKKILPLDYREVFGDL